MRGGSVPIIYSEPNFRDRYLDEYTGEIHSPHLIRDAIIDELDYFNDKVCKLSSKEGMENIPDYILVGSRWVLCNKSDAESPDVRARLVSCELNKDGKQDAFASSTLLSRARRSSSPNMLSPKTEKANPCACPL